MTPTERVRLTAVDFASREQVRFVDARWFRDDLLIIWQWNAGNPDKPLKSLIVEGARSLATRSGDGNHWELAGKYIFPGFFETPG